MGQMKIEPVFYLLKILWGARGLKPLALVDAGVAAAKLRKIGGLWMVLCME